MGVMSLLDISLGKCGIVSPNSELLVQISMFDNLCIKSSNFCIIHD